MPSHLFENRAYYYCSAVDFKPRFRVDKIDIKTKKERCGTSRYFNEKCLCPTFPLRYVSFRNVFSEDPSKIEKLLWYRERYWQSELFTFTHGMKCINDLYRKKRKGYRT